MEILVAGLMVALTMTVFGTHRPRKDMSISWASLLITVSLILNLDPVYLSTNRLLGGRNYADLGANLLLLIGIYFLARAIHRAATPTADRGSPPRILGVAGVVVATCGAAVLFAAIDAPSSSTEFMREYGAQPSAALYSAIQYTYIGTVMAAAGGTCLKFRKSWRTGVYRVAFAFVGLGCASAVLLVALVLALDALHVLGQLQTMTSLSGVYEALNLSTFFLLCTGLALPPARRSIQAMLDATRTNTVLKDLRPVWNRAVMGNSGVTLDLRVIPDRGQKPHRVLHRMIVEIQDSLATDPCAEERIGPDGLNKLASASKHLERQSWASK